ncbi:CHAP domain-containing protein [Streptosporangiaceae bacterium NEAU-GS5]|nr:CHAP domain-containing protein [Streptosporangiaceae bacterium NEAU-GS5]
MTRRLLQLLLLAATALLAVAPVTRAEATPAATPAFVVGHARLAGDDYPYATLGQFEQSRETDPWNEFAGQCDSFTAWKVYENLGGTARLEPDRIPDAGFAPADAARSPVWGTAAPTTRANWGDARDWGKAARAAGYAVDAVARPGSIAWWNHQGTGMPVGHVGYVTDVYPDGTIAVEAYNQRANGQYSRIHIGRNGLDDTSFHLPVFHVPWPTGFVHIGDTAVNIVQPPVPAPPVTYHYARNVYGPGDGGGFALGGSAYPGSDHGWYTRTGGGELGAMRWTNTHPGAADSTATWTPSLVAGACYAVAAFVPDTLSNNPAALYRVAGTFATVDENAYSNAWAPLGVFRAASDGGLPVTLTDQGSDRGYVAADAIRFVRQLSC